MNLLVFFVKCYIILSSHTICSSLTESKWFSVVRVLNKMSKGCMSCRPPACPDRLITPNCRTNGRILDSNHSVIASNVCNRNMSLRVWWHLNYFHWKFVVQFQESVYTFGSLFVSFRSESAFVHQLTKWHRLYANLRCHWRKEWTADSGQMRAENVHLIRNSHTISKALLHEAEWLSVPAKQQQTNKRREILTEVCLTLSCPVPERI